MRDENKTKKQLFKELTKLRQRVAELESIQAKSKQTETALRESEDKYRQLFELESDAIFLIENETGQILEANPAATEMYGYSREELLHKKNTDLSAEPKETRQVTQETPVIVDQVVSIPLRFHRKKDGTVFPVEITGRFFTWGGRPVHIAAVRDITQRRRAERLLQALNAVGLAMEKALTPEGIFVTVSQELTKLGFSCAVFLTDKSQTQLLPQYLSYDLDVITSAEKQTGLQIKDFVIPIDTVTMYKQVIRDKQVVFIEDVQDVVRQVLPDPFKGLAGQIINALEIPKSINAPLVVGDEVIGLLSVQSDNLTPEDIPAITAFAYQMAAAWNKANLLEHAQQEIVERKRVEETLRASEAELRALFAAMTDVVLVVDAEGRYLKIAPTNPALLYKPPDDLLGKTLHQIFPKEQADAFLGYVQHTLETGQPFDCEYSLSIDGREVWFAAVLSPMTENTVLLVARDITERKRAEETLRQRNRELALLNRAGHAISSSLDLDQVLATLLEEARNLMDVIACSVWLVEPATDRLICRHATGPQSELVHGWRLALGQGIAGWVAQNGQRLVVPDTDLDPRHFKEVDQQTGLPVRSILSVPLRVKGKVMGVLQVVDEKVDRFKPADLMLIESLAATAAVAIENARMFAQEEQRAVELAHALEQRQELDRLRHEFTQNVSHELRTPLAIALGYTELLERGELGELQPKQHESIIIIARRLHLLSKLVSDINAILEIETKTLEREPVNLSNLVQAVVTDFQTAASQADLTLALQDPPDLPPVLGDITQLHRMVDNLLSNAVKFTPGGGQIVVRLEQEEENLVLQVSDTGIGVPEDKLERIFERFYQVDGSVTRRYGGTGLGLALVKEIAELHGGGVTVKSTLDEGSTFQITLPVLKT